MHADNMIYLYQTYYLMTAYHKRQDNSMIYLWYTALDKLLVYFYVTLAYYKNSGEKAIPREQPNQK